MDTTEQSRRIGLMLADDRAIIETKNQTVEVTTILTTSEWVLVKAHDRDDFDHVLGRLLVVPTETGFVIDVIETHPLNLRQGVATALLGYARSFLGPIEHSADRSVHGEAWARSLGETLPDCAQHTPVDMSQFALWEDALEIACDDPELAATIVSYFPENAALFIAEDED